MSLIHKQCFGRDAAAGTFIIRRARKGNWRVSTPDNRCGGYFASVDEARRFARAEARICDHAEVLTFADDALALEVFDNSRLASSMHMPAAGSGRKATEA